MQKRKLVTAYSWIFSLLLMISLLCLTMSFVQDVRAESEFHEYQVKAAFLYNFAKFVEWTPGTFKDASTPIRICTIGSDPFGKYLDELRDKNVGARTLEIVRLKGKGELEKCQILFISASEKQNISEILRIVQKKPILTVGEMQGFAQSGGIINLVTIGRKVSLEINLDASQRSGLKISSQLLKLATIIK